MKKNVFRELHNVLNKEEIKESVNTDLEIVTETNEKNVKNTTKSGKKNVKKKEG